MPPGVQRSSVSGAALEHRLGNALGNVEPSRTSVLDLTPVELPQLTRLNSLKKVGPDGKIHNPRMGGAQRTSGTGGFGPGRKLPSHDAALLRAQFKTRQSNLVHNPQMNQARSDSHTKTRKANLQQPGAGLVSYRNKGKSSDAESSSAPPMQGYRNRSGLAPAPNDIILKPMEERLDVGRLPGAGAADFSHSSSLKPLPNAVRWHANASDKEARPPRPGMQLQENKPPETVPVKPVPPLPFPKANGGTSGKPDSDIQGQRTEDTWDAVAAAVNRAMPGVTKEYWNSTPQERQGIVVSSELSHFLECSKDTGFLNLSRNTWPEVPKQVEYFLTDHGNKLKSLDLEINAIETCPDLAMMPKLISLNLSDNRLSALKGISALSVLTTLCLEKNKLTILPDAISECKSLTYLDISMNQLQWLPDSFRKLTELKTLKMEHNHLSHVPMPVCSMVELKELNAAHNMVTGIPADIGNLQHLQILRLHHNNLSSLPYTIGGLWRTLKELELNDNDLSYLPSTLGLCKKLETLDLGVNPLQFPPLTVVQQGTEAVIGFLSGSNDKMMFDSRYSFVQASGQAKDARARQAHQADDVKEILSARIQRSIHQFCSNCSQHAYEMAMGSEDAKIQLQSQISQLLAAIEEKEYDLEAAREDSRKVRNLLVGSNKGLRTAEKALRDAMAKQTLLLEKTVMQEADIGTLQKKLTEVATQYSDMQRELNRLRAATEQCTENGDVEGKLKTLQETLEENARLRAEVEDARKLAEAAEKLAQDRKDGWLWAAGNWRKSMAEREQELATVQAENDAREQRLTDEVERLKSKVKAMEIKHGVLPKYMHFETARCSQKAAGANSQQTDGNHQVSINRRDGQQQDLNTGKAIARTKSEAMERWDPTDKDESGTETPQ